MLLLKTKNFIKAKQPLKWYKHTKLTQISVLYSIFLLQILSKTAIFSELQKQDVFCPVLSPCSLLGRIGARASRGGGGGRRRVINRGLRPEGRKRQERKGTGFQLQESLIANFETIRRHFANLYFLTKMHHKYAKKRYERTKINFETLKQTIESF
jgi:hypothetical protein